MKIVATGPFGARVRAQLTRYLASQASLPHVSPGGDGSIAIVITEAYDPLLLSQVSGEAEVARLACCFLTARGVFVSCWLSSAGPCVRCFQARWYANLAFWEHSADDERVLEKLEQLQPGLRSFAVPETATFLAASALMELINTDGGSRVCRYIDLASCRLSPGILHRVSDCDVCGRQDLRGGRYTRDLSETLGWLRTTR